MLKKVTKLSKRRGTKPFKILFQVKVHYLISKQGNIIGPNARLNVCFERGRKTESTNDAVFHDCANGTSEVVFEQTLSIIATLYQSSNDHYLEKTGRLVVREKQNADETYKVFGVAMLPLHTYAKMYGETREVLPLTKCAYDGLTIDVTITPKHLESDGNAEDSMSIASDSEMGESVTYCVDGVMDDYDQEHIQRERSLSTSSSSSIKLQAVAREKAKPLASVIGEEEKLSACYERDNDDIRALEEENEALKRQLESTMWDLSSSRSHVATLEAALAKEKKQKASLEARLEHIKHQRQQRVEEVEHRKRGGCLSSLCGLRSNNHPHGANFVRMGSREPISQDDDVVDGTVDDNAKSTLLLHHSHPAVSMPDRAAEISLDRSVDRSTSSKSSAYMSQTGTRKMDGSRHGTKAGANSQQKVKKRSPCQRSKPDWLN
mmetsp:Transcript_2817/g.4269  ORF Transcript_2817/g.4269 Transcript_2817/m.4269 type:complete len:434 (+) Transcript_2817:155-1456(+)|eukprot:CAMPEP_0185034394 /NCGR_PEP_ID=MMETSP1103-20130426/24253_1 /TAXON_ID=36769 /ORGANISM="Paraphysomonas bandaiensis, Strain Caron Lab Isolate" /LENGTH=433 /DNA_ID=CAMNT_0027571035 /DNA_START=80 /DNA_END=1381 /DNA_ORIENTATION=+